MKKLNKKKMLIFCIISFAIITLIICLLLNMNVNVKTELFDLTENEPLKQTYVRNQSHFINDILPNSKMSEEQYKDFLENPDDYIVYSLRCKIKNNSNKELTAQYEIDKENMWIDTVTMANTNNIIMPNSEINKNISILVKLDGKNKEQSETEIKDITVKIHIYNSKNDNQKEIKTISAKF